MPLTQLLRQRPDVWRGRALPAAAPLGLATGFAALDAALPWRGWPPDALSELLTEHQGAGLALALPLLIALSRGPRWLLLVSPPLVPFAPALAARGLDLTRLVVVQAGADTAWAIEQGLRSGACAAVLGWLDAPSAPAPARLKRERDAAARQPKALRRLQLAAVAGGTPALLLRPPSAAATPSPAALRLLLRPAEGGIELTLLKQRGGRPGTRLVLGATPVEPAPASPRTAHQPHRSPTAHR